MSLKNRIMQSNRREIAQAALRSLVMVLCLAALAVAATQPPHGGGAAGRRVLLPRQYFGAVIGSLMLTFHNPRFDIIQLGYSPLLASVAPDRGSSILLLTDRILVVQGTERIRTIDLPGPVAEPSFLSHFSLVVWSPDSTQVALTVRSTAPGGESTGLTAAIADLKTGAIHLVADGYAAGWSDDGQGLLLLRPAALPAPCDSHTMSCPTSDLLMWRGGKLRVLVTARQLWAQGEGNSWPLAWNGTRRENFSRFHHWLRHGTPRRTQLT